MMEMSHTDRKCEVTFNFSSRHSQVRAEMGSINGWQVGKFMREPSTGVEAMVSGRSWF